MSRIIITVVGKDRVGIIATVCTYLAEHNINILDIDQSISAGFFPYDDDRGCQQDRTKDFADLGADLEKIGRAWAFRSRCSMKIFSI